MNTTQNRVSRGMPTGGQFATTQQGEPSVALGSADAESHREEFAGRMFRIEASEGREGNYTVYEDEGEVADFDWDGDPSDRAKLREEAKDALTLDDIVEICSVCDEDSSGGEGFDGMCGNCADRSEKIVFAEEHNGEEVNVIRDEFGTEGGYAVQNEDGREIANFTYYGDAEDHNNIWDAAQKALGSAPE